MATFQKYGLNRQNTAIEKALIPTSGTAASNSSNIVTVVREDAQVFGSIRVSGTHAALVNPPSGWETENFYWDIEQGTLTVTGTTTTWESLTFLVI